MSCLTRLVNQSNFCLLHTLFPVPEECCWSDSSRSCCSCKWILQRVRSAKGWWKVQCRQSAGLPQESTVLHTPYPSRCNKTALLGPNIPVTLFALISGVIGSPLFPITRILFASVEFQGPWYRSTARTGHLIKRTEISNCVVWTPTGYLTYGNKGWQTS